MKMYKHTCECGNVWFSEFDVEYDCDSCESDEDEEEEQHYISTTSKLTAEEYAEIWSDSLENDNRHSLTNLPYDILRILSKRIKDKRVIRNLMKQFQEEDLGS